MVAFGLALVDFAANLRVVNDMLIQHIDLFVSSHESPIEGDYTAPLEGIAEHTIQCIGSSGIWDAWVVPLSNLQDLASLTHVEACPIPDDSSHVSLRVSASQQDKRVGLRIYILSQ